jgi:drug/metabolite transporter (DMT)-like permease
MKLSARNQAYLALTIAALIWGASQPITKPALEFITPIQFIFLRFVIAAPLTIPLIIRGHRQHRLNGRQWLTVLGIEAVSVITLILVFTGLTYVSAFQSSLILQTRPIFVTLAGLIFLNENIRKHEWIGLLISVIGISAILFRPFFLHPDGLTSVSFIGTSILLLTNIMYTGTLMLIKKQYKSISKSAATGIHAWVGIIIASLFLIPTNNLPTMATILEPTVLTAIIYMGIMSSIIALTLSHFAVGKIETSEATLFSYLQPLVYIPLTTLWLGEKIYSAQIVGMLCILFGVWYAERRPGKRKHKQLLKHGTPILWRIRLALSENNHSPITPER